MRPRLFETGRADAARPIDDRPSIATGFGYDPAEGSTPRLRVPSVIAAVALTALVCMAVAWWWRDGRAGHVGPTPLATSVDEAVPKDDATAVLVDDGRIDASTTVDPLAALRARAQADARAQPGDAVADDAPNRELASVSRTLAETGSGRNVPTARAGPASRSAPPRRDRQASDADLLATLLANIRERPPAPSASTQAQTLDELIAQLRQRDNPTAAKTDVVAGTVGRTGAETPEAEGGSAKLQTRLRSCPAANTLDGIRCRQKLCAQAKADPACPKQ